ncbi:hypothetical protein V1512DRAFT_266925 [Lipomyces arxii]|uniref:uncharacterized protein n=1 Tax=Lipomyces arxii TaxID=56418 RepID=UPI0034CE25A6
MPKKSSASLQELLDKLTVHAQNDEHTYVLDLANKMLRQDSTDFEAKKAKIIALIKLDRYSEALSVFDGDSLSPSELALERAYCLYRLGKTDDANELIDSAQRNEGVTEFQARGLLHLKAQIAYRLEKFADSKKTYDELAQGPYMVDGEEHDSTVNTFAIQVQERWWNINPTVVEPTDIVSHEQAFNLATLRIGEKKYKEALELLAKAKSFAQALDGLSQSELEDELNPILIQAAYAHILLGEKTEAAEILSGFDVKSISEPLIKDLVINNLLYLANIPGYDSINPHVSLRILDSVVQNKTSKSAYIEFQRRLLQKNKIAIEYRAGKESAVKAGIKRHLEAFPEDQSVRLVEFRPAVLDPFAVGGKYSSKNALAKVLKKFEHEPANIGLGFACVQLLLEAKNVDHAAHIIEKILASGVPDYPGLLVVAYQVYESQGRHKDAAKLLERLKAQD